MGRQNKKKQVKEIILCNNSINSGDCYGDSYCSTFDPRAKRYEDQYIKKMQS